MPGPIAKLNFGDQRNPVDSLKLSWPACEHPLAIKFQGTVLKLFCMKKITLILWFVGSFLGLTAQNVGIGISSPAARFHIKGATDVTQLIIDANSAQSNSNPLVVLRSSSGESLMWIHSDHVSNSFIGLNSGRVNDITINNSSGRFNTFVGSNAGYSNVSGTGNTAIGYQSLYANNTGTHNTAHGVYSLFTNSSGSNNTAIGVQSLYLNNSGSFNTATGELSLYTNSVGISNTANGYQALQFSDNGSYNTAMGVAALIANNSGNDNTAIGVGSLYSNTTGSNNTAIGFHALLNNYQGSQNIAIGQNSGNVGPNLNNTIGIGNDSYLMGLSNQVLIGNASTSFIGGAVDFSVNSDARIKNNITEDVKGLDFILHLRPVTYHVNIKAISAITGNPETPDFPEKYDREKVKYTGFIAQEVEQAAKNAEYDFSGVSVPQKSTELYSLRYAEFVVPLVKAVQEQQALIESLQKQTATLKAENVLQTDNQQLVITQLQQQISLLERKLDALETRTK
jgi:hypothetical protein